MFQPNVLKIVSYIALVCCALGLVTTVVLLTTTGFAFSYVLVIISWLLLLYASYLGIKLSVYDIYDEDRQKLGISVYGILLLFILFLSTGISLGILAALYITYRLHVQKTNMDEWMAKHRNPET